MLAYKRNPIVKYFEKWTLKSLRQFMFKKKEKKKKKLRKKTKPVFAVFTFPSVTPPVHQKFSILFALKQYLATQKGRMRKTVPIVGLIASGSCYISSYSLLLSNCSPQAQGTIHLPLGEPHKGSAYEHRGSLLANKHGDLTPAML